MTRFFATLSSTSIRARIVAGFGMFVALLALIAFLYDMQLRSVRTEMENVVRATEASEAIAKFDRDVLDTRRLITRYFGSPTAGEQVAARQAQTQLVKKLEDIKRSVNLPTDEISAILNRYTQSFDQLVSEIKARQSAYSTIVSAGANLVNTVNSITKNLVRIGASEASVSARLQENVQAYVTYATRYTMRGNSADADNAGSELERVAREFASLQGLQTDDVWLKATIARLETPIAKLTASHTKLLETTKGVTATSTSLNTIGVEIGDSAEALKAALTASRNMSVDSARTTVKSVLWTGIVASAGAIFLGIAIAFLISKSISVLVRRITATMERLAGGHLDTGVTDTARTDDIGAMARAVEVFKQNGLKAKQMEEEAIRQRNLADEERHRNAMIERNRTEAMTQATRGLADGLDNLARGNLTFELREPFAADFESLRQNFNAAAAQLAETLATVALASRSIRDGSHEISQGAEDLSKRTEHQAASLEETAAALDQITANVTNASKRVNDAKDIADAANNSARQAGVVVSSAVDAMQKISASSTEISNIIGVIDDIAFQTNLLALNAGVEAARAGEAGKGFAVVAQEVRELAQRSARAAKEIKQLIMNSTAQVEGGVKLVSDTGAALKSIEAYIVDINDHMSSIATSAREQSLGLSEVNVAINQMDQVTQQNAAMVEQTSAAGVKLATEAEHLRDMIARFQIGNRGQEVVQHHQPPSPRDQHGWSSSRTKLSGRPPSRLN